jgi:hypothetical protein
VPSVVAAGQQEQQQKEVAAGGTDRGAIMRVRVELHGHLQIYAKDGGKCVEIDIKEGATVGELIT